MKTSKTNLLPEIEWKCYNEKNDKLDGFYEAKGVDNKGIFYSGYAEFSDGGFIGMTNIEKETKDFCAICGDYGNNTCTPNSNCMNKTFINILDLPG